MQRIIMKSSVILASLLLIFSLGGCQQPISGQMVGTGVGAGLGGLLGSRFGRGSGRTAATIGGAVIGGLLGSSIGRNMDETNRLHAERAMAHRRQTKWHSQGHNYHVSGIRNCGGRMCRTIIDHAPDGTRIQETLYCVKLKANGVCSLWRRLH